MSAHCTNHPDVETTLSCAGCSRPFCPDCLVPLEKLHLCADCKAKFLGEGESGVVPAPPDAPTAKRRRAPRRRRTRESATPWVIGFGALAFVLIFAFIVLTRLARPVVEDRQAEKLADALEQLAIVGAAVERYRVETGDFPTELAKLVPDYLTDVPTDPYRKKQAPVYRREKSGEVLLYSVGPDKKDNDGTPWDPQEETGDLVYLLN